MPFADFAPGDWTGQRVPPLSLREMSLYSRIKALIGRTSASASPKLLAIRYALGTPQGARQVLQAFRNDPWLMAVTGVIADGVANAHWRVYKRVSDGAPVRDYQLQVAGFDGRTKALKALRRSSDVIEAPDHELLRILGQPSPHLTGRATLRLICQHLLLAGEAFLLLTRNTESRVIGFEVIPPDKVIGVPAGERQTFQIAYENLQGHFPASEVIWLRTPDVAAPHGRGLGMGQALGDQLDTIEALEKALRATFVRGGMPGAVVSYQAGENEILGDEALEDMQRKFEAAFYGPENANRIFFTNGKTTVSPINTTDLKQLQGQELHKALRDAVRMCFGVPAEMLGDAGTSNYAASLAAKYTLADHVILPKLEQIRTELQARLVPLVDASAVLTFDDPRPASHERAQALMTSTITASAFLKNEARTMAGLEPLPELEGQFLPVSPGTPGAEAPLPAAQEPLFRNVR